MPKKKSNTMFEDSIAELEAIVDSMEEDNLPLETLISNYEKGAKLHQQCEEFLNSAKERLETIANPKAQSPKATQANPPSSNDDDEIRLF